jgi:peptidoglycan hydrolase CwlO-like protein
VAKKKKSQSDAVEKKARARIRKLEAWLASAEKSAGKWKARAKKHQTDAAGLKSELTAVRRRLEKATASAAKWKDRAKAAPPSMPRPERTAPAVSTTAPTGPDESWTVTRLRAEARARGVAGYSRRTKAQLLADLGG